MDCNRDEATRAREMAEKKLMEKDLLGAKRYASKARELYPGLDGLFQLQQILEICTAYERRISREVDWYGVLGVDPLADVQTLRRSYRKLALALHPDKNKAVGAEGAFKIVSEAWNLLSDTVKRTSYDQKLNIRASYGNNSGLSTAAGIQVNDRCNFNNSASARNDFCTPVNLPTHSTPAGNNFFTPVNHPTHSAPIRPSGTTFWTSCKPCKTQFEYLAIYRNQTLLCRNCRRPFLALEVPPPANSNIPRRKNSMCQNQKSGFPSGNTLADSGKEFTTAPKRPSPGSSHVDSMSKENNQKTYTSKVGGSRNKRTSARAAAQCVDGSQLTGEHLMRGHDENINVVDVEKTCDASNDTNGSEPFYGLSLGKDEKLSKLARVGHYKFTLLRKDAHNRKPQSVAGSGSSNDSQLHMDMQGTGNLFYPENSRCNVSKELSLPKARDMLVVKAKMEIRKKLQEWNAAAVKNTVSSRKVNEDVDKDKDMPTVLAGTAKARNSNTSSKGQCISNQPRNSPHSSGLACSFVRSTDVASEDVAKGSFASSLMGSGTEGNELKTMSVPDPEFYDFDKDRIEEVFSANQVWAAYDDEDGMPRNYVLIHDVISINPFKVRISWLNSKSNSELGQLNWIECGFAKTCGDFRVGKREAYSSLISFSHKVKWSKGIRGVIRIFPKKGDVWALYRNWSSEWNGQTPADVIWKYDMVEVADDFNEEQGVLVTPLVKVAGFRSVFHRLDTSKEYRIPRAEMFRFSHQVASYTLTGQEAKTVPKGCLELDTAAMPLELLQIITESMEREGSKESRSRDANAGNAIAHVYSRKRKEIIKEPGEGSKQSGRDDTTARSPITLVYSRKRKGRSINV